ncbi:MAG: hypothetical protein ACK5KQ_04310 [Anaerorhabdus sp.]
MIKKSIEYFVSSFNGCDNNDGRSKAKAFSSILKINEILKKEDIDIIHLECDSVFNDQFLHIYNSNDITIKSYGKGKRPQINCSGNGLWYQDYRVQLDNVNHTNKGYVSSAILLYDVSSVTIKNIAITNTPKFKECYSDPYKMCRTGISIVAQNNGIISNISISDVVIKDVNGNVYDKHMNNGGIIFSVLKPFDESKTGIAKFDKITVENCYLSNVSRWGISVGYTYNHNHFNSVNLLEEKIKKFSNENILIRNNYVKNIGGDGITVMYAIKPLVENNICDTVAKDINDEIYKHPSGRGGMVAAGIWPWKCKDAVFRYNQGLNTRLNQDGMPWDADSGDGTIYEYNYSRLNEGGCVMFCLEESVNNIFRNNISYDDLVGTISPAHNKDAVIENNTFHKRKSTPLIRKGMDGGKYTLKDNLIIDLDD